MRFREFKRQSKDWGFGVAWYNFKFDLAMKMLHAKSMRVVQKKR